MDVILLHHEACHELDELKSLQDKVANDVLISDLAFRGEVKPGMDNVHLLQGMAPHEIPLLSLFELATFLKIVVVDNEDSLIGFAWLLKRDVIWEALLCFEVGTNSDRER